MKCSKCGKKAVIHRKYEGSLLCRNHFILSIESKAKKTIRKSNMIARGDKIAFALSGGQAPGPANFETASATRSCNAMLRTNDIAHSRLIILPEIYRDMTIP